MNFGEQLLYACRRGCKDIIQLLLEKGAKVNAKDYYKNTALTYATVNGFEEGVELLLENGADVNAKDALGHTSLDCARRMKHNKVIRVLEEYVQAKEKLEFIEGL